MVFGGVLSHDGEMRNKFPEKLAKEVVALLTEQRRKKQLSYSDLAEGSGISCNAISLIEKGQRNPTLLSCLKLCQAMNISLADVIRRAEKSIK